MTESKTRTRMKVLAGLVAFMFAALSTRLWFLQVLATDQFAAMADQNQVRLVPLVPLRGQILDRTGQVLVGNRRSTIITVDRLAMEDREDEVLFRLSKLLDIPVGDLLDRLDSVKYLPYQPVPVAEDVPKEAVFYIAEHHEQFPGVTYQVGSVREYPQGRMASQMLGWVGEISDTQLEQSSFNGYRPGVIVGKSGVESTYERDLYGQDGTREIQVNAQGHVLDQNFGGAAATPGNNVILSIDAKIQALAERSLTLGIKLARRTPDRNSGKLLEATGGAVIVMDPRNGQVLGMASNPTYDPSIFLGGLSYREALGLDLCFPGRPCPKDKTHNQPLLNRATQGLYPAGSTFKPFIAAAAMRERFAKMDGKYNCPSIYYAPIDPTRHPFHNWSSLDYGFISLPNALAVSCDTVFYDFGYKFWLKYHNSKNRNELLQRDLALMGFGRKTGVDIPGEQAGRVPDFESIRQTFRANPKVYGQFYGWLPGDSIELAIGQGFLTVTPMQLAVGFSALANGGTLYAPHVAERIENADDGSVIRKIGRAATGHLPISRKEINFIRKSLEGVTTYGTAKSAFFGFPLTRIPVAGKTGTADIIPQQPYSWFAAMAPANDPKYVVIALVEQGGHGATTAAPMVRRVLDGLFGLGTAGPLHAGPDAD